MGLDMYLNCRYKGDSDFHELIYWRKMNAIHNWFIKNGRMLDEKGRLVPADSGFNCGEIPVDKEMLTDLLHDINSVIANHSLAHKVLPTVDGFFFGSTNYDDDYYYELERTAHDIVDLIHMDLEWGDLENDEIGGVYYTCWW